MKKYPSKSIKNRTLSKSKSTSKIPSQRNSRSNIKNSPTKINIAKIKNIETIQRNWRYYFKKNIENKIIKIQSVYRGYNIRRIFNEIIILNKKLECFLFLIKITMFRHGIKYDYMSNKRIDYYIDHKKTKNFLLLQKKIRYFLFMKKINLLNQIGIFDNIYIKTLEYRKKIKSKNSEDKYFAKPIYKYHMPLSKIIKIQKNYKLHLKYIKKLPKHNINKISLNKCPLITKITKMKIIDKDEIYKNVKMKPINNGKDFYYKINYNYTPLILIQRKYKSRFKYLNDNYKLKKHEKIKRKVINKHHYIYHATVIDESKKVLLIQKNIKYFIYRKHSIINLIPKIKIEKCEIVKSYGFKEYIKQFFYEEFVTRLIVIIRKFFLSLYLNELLRNYRLSKIKRINTSIGSKRNSTKDKSSLHFTNKVNKTFKKKETFNLSPKKNKQVVNKPRHSSLLNNSDSSMIKDKGSSKKKVSFKNESKLVRKETKNFGSKGSLFSSDSESSIKTTKTSKMNELNNNIKKKSNYGTNKSASFHKKK